MVLCKTIEPQKPHTHPPPPMHGINEDDLTHPSPPSNRTINQSNLKTNDDNTNYTPTTSPHQYQLQLQPADNYDENGDGYGFSRTTTTTPLTTTLSRICYSTYHKGWSRIKNQWKALLAAQFLSLLLSVSGALNASLHLECNISVPTTQAGLIYGLLSLHLVWVFVGGCSGGGSGCFRSGSGRGRGGGCPCRGKCCNYSRIGDDIDTDDVNADNQPEEDTPSQFRIDDETVIGGVYGNTEYNDDTIIGIGNGNGNTLPNEDQNQETNTNTTCSSSTSLTTFPTTYTNTNTNTKIIKGSLWIYFAMAFLDVEANYCIYLAFRYTTLTSVALLDALAIPSAMLTSRFLLARSYRRAHFVGAAVCMIGVSFNIVGDSDSDNGTEDDDSSSLSSLKYSNRVLGDILAIGGSILYGLNDVFAEWAIKEVGGVQEYLGMVGLFGAIICIVQALVFERDQLSLLFGGTTSTDHDIHNNTNNDPTNYDDEATCPPSRAWLILTTSTLVTTLGYVWMSHLLQVSEAALLNLSLLTGDLWSVAFSVVAEGIFPSLFFWIALALIFVGVFVYELSPSPVVGSSGGVGDGDGVASGVGGGGESTVNMEGVFCEQLVVAERRGGDYDDNGEVEDCGIRNII